MKNNQYIQQAQYKKGFIVPILIAIIALLVAGGGAYIYQNKKTEVPAVVDTTTQQLNQIQQQTKSSQTDTSTLNWETYSNADFSLKYPATWYLNSSSPGFINITNYDSSVIPGSDAPISSENIWINVSSYPPGKYNNFSINETLESWVNKIGLSDKQNILIDDIKAVRGKIIYTGEEESGYFQKGESSGDLVLVTYNSKGYLISYSPNDSKFINTFNQILSTFKFTK